MGKLKKMLGDERGATILMALFALLLASMVCVVILSAASSSVKQEHAERAALQDELTLKSAGTMLADNLACSDTKCTIAVTKTPVEENGSTTTRVSRTVSVSSRCLIDFALKGAFEGLPIEGTATTAPTGQIFFGAASAETGDGVAEEQSHGAYESEVQVTYALDPASYGLAFRLDLMDGTESKATLFLDLSAQASGPVKTGTESEGVTETTTVTWSDPVFSRSEAMRS